MSATQFKCPSCGATLKTANPLPAGKMIKCPKCTAAFPVPGSEEDKASPKAAGQPKPAAVSKPAGAAKQAISKTKPAPTRKPVADDDDWEEEDRPLPKKAVKKPADDWDDDEPRPRKAIKKAAVDEEDYEDDEPRPKKKEKKQKSSPVLLWGLIGGGALLLIGGGVVAAVLLLGGKDKDKGKPGPGDNTTYTLKIKSDPDIGKSTVNHDTDDLRQNNIKLLTRDEEYTETVLEPGDKHPKKFKRTYQKATQGMGEQTVTRGYQGRTVIFELREAGASKFYQVRVEKEAGKPNTLPPSEQTELVKEPNKALQHARFEEIVLPKNAVKVGETWAVDGQEVAKLLTEIGELDTASGKAEAKLVKVHEKDGKQYGVIEFDIQMPIKSLKFLPGVRLESPGQFESKTTLDTVIDGSSTAGVMTNSVKITAKLRTPQGNQDIALESSSKRERSEEKPAEAGKP